MKAWNQWPSWGIALAAALWLVAPFAHGVVLTVNDADAFNDALADTNVTEIVLGGGPTGTAVSFTLPVPQSINRSLVIRGQGSKQPYEIRVEAPGDTVFDVFENNVVTFENLTFVGGGVSLSRGVVARFNRVLFEGGNVGIETVTATSADLNTDDIIPEVIVANCSFSNTGVGIALRGPGDRAYVYQSTFVGPGTNVEITEGGIAAMALCLFGTGGFLTGSTGFVTLQACLPDFGLAPPNVETDPINPVPANAPDFAVPGLWPGQLKPSGIIQSGLSFGTDLSADLRGKVDEFSDRDFEGQGRSKSNLQVGADEVGGVVFPPQWISVEVSVDPVGKNKETEISIVTEFDLQLGDQLLIVPESVTNDIGFDMSLVDESDYIALDIPFEDDATALTGVTVPYTPTATYINNGNTLLDGRATIMLVAGGVVYNPLSATASNITPDVNADAYFVIDTVAPEYHSGTLGTARDLVVGANESLTALTAPNGVPADFPANWTPQTVPWPTNDALIGNTAGRTPVILLNTPEAQLLDLSIAATFVDVQKQDSDLTPVAYAGFEATTSTDSAVGANIKTFLNAVPDAPEDYSSAYWEVADIPGATNTSTLTANFAPSSLVSEGLDATWTLTGLDYAPGWNMVLRIIAVDAAGNGSEESIPLSVWWLDGARGVISSAPSGTATSDPTFSWGIEHDGASPGDVAPLVPVASFRLWQADAPGPNPSWSPITNWAPYTSAQVVGRTAVVERLTAPSPPIRLGEILDNPALQGQQLMLTVMGADEAGNVQPWLLPADGPLTYADLALEGIDYAVWQNGEAAGSDATRLDTAVSSTFWHNRVDNTAGIYTVDAAEQNFGDARQIPLQAESDCFVRVEGRFDVQLDFPDDLDPAFERFAQWELFEDGRLVATGFLRDNTNDLTLQLPEDILNPRSWVLPLRFPVVPVNAEDFLNEAPSECLDTKDRLGDDGDSEVSANGPRNRQRNVSYLLTIAAGYGEFFPTEPCADCVFDPTPASVGFTVTISNDTRGGENPVIVNQKLGN